MIRIAAIGLLFCAGPAGAQSTYLAGGVIPFPPEQKAILDRHGEILSLGINHDWLRASQIDVPLYVEAISIVATAVENEEIPGALIYVDRFASNTMPAAIGYTMTDPQKHRAQWDTSYYVHDLTGAVVTVPLVHLAISEKRLSLTDNVGELLPQLAGRDKASITVEMLLRHASGLPAEIPDELEIRSDEAVYEALAGIPLVAEPGEEHRVSPLNFLLLGLIVEQAREAPLSVQFSTAIYTFLQVEMASMTLPANRRQFVAPDHYSERLGRLAWMEPIDPFGEWLAPDAGHVGLTAPAESFSILGKALLTFSKIDAAANNFGLPSYLDTVRRADPLLRDGERMGLGVKYGLLGEESIGWDSPFGSSFWVLPGQDAFIVYLSNPMHPDGIQPGWVDPRDRVLPLLAEALAKGREHGEADAVAEDSDE